MNRREALAMRFGEMLDLISCLAVYNGNAKEKTGNRFTFGEGSGDDILFME